MRTPPKSSRSTRLRAICIAPLASTSTVVLSHSRLGLTIGAQVVISPCASWSRIKYALEKSPNKLETTARNTQRPIFGADENTVSWLVGITPCFVHGFSRRRCTSNHQAVIAVRIAMTMAGNIDRFSLRRVSGQPSDAEWPFGG